MSLAFAALIKGFGFLVVAVYVSADGHDELLEVVEYAAPNARDCEPSITHPGGSPFGLLENRIAGHKQIISLRSNGQPVEASQLGAV